MAPLERVRDAAGPRQRLRATVDASRNTGFAVVDGGQFDGLPAAFRRERLFARSLFLDRGDPEVEKAGPWLVKLDHEAEADKVFSLVGDKPAAVYWSCVAGEVVLHRHLRSINMVLIPAWAQEGKDRPPDETEDENFSRVFFRHFDPRVLGALSRSRPADHFRADRQPAEADRQFSETARRVREAEWQITKHHTRSRSQPCDRPST